MKLINTLQFIRENYPKTWEWMEHKANWEQMSIGAVLKNYNTYIEELKIKEGNNGN